MSKLTLAAEAARRRTFAIISHPDAGKTTLTENLLLAGGRDPRGRRRAGARREPAHPVRLDEDRARAGHLGLGLGDDVRPRRPDVQPAGHAGPRGLLGRHLPHADRRRLRRHGAGRRQGHRAADAEAVRGLPPARHPDHHLHQQDGPRGAGPVRPAGRDRLQARAGPGAALLAGRLGRPLQGHARPATRQVPALSPRRPPAQDEDHGHPERPAAGQRRRQLPRPRRAGGAGGGAGTGQEAGQALRPAVLPGRPHDAGASSARRCATSASTSCWTASAPTPRRPRPWPARKGRRGDPRRAPGDREVTGFVFKVQANMDPNHRDRIAFLQLCLGPVHSAA